MSVQLVYKDIAPGAKDDIQEIITSEIVPQLSNIEKLKSESVEVHHYATLEHNQWKLDGTFKALTQNNVTFWSNQLSQENLTDNGYLFDTPVILTRIFNSKHTSVGVTIKTDDECFCSYVNIKWYDDENLIGDKDFKPDSSEFYCSQNIELFNKVVITFYAMNKPNRFLKIWQIDDGVYRNFYTPEIYSISVLEEMSLISEELPINTLQTTLKRAENTEYIFQKKQPLYAYLDGKLYGTFFVDSSDRTSKDVYEVSAQDYKGILDTSKFYGNIYFDVPAKTIIDEIFAGEKFRYDIDNITASTVLSGYIPPCTKREALGQVLFACCSVCTTARLDYLKIFKLQDTEKEVDADRIYIGGKLSTSDIVTSVKINIHKYIKNTSTSELFNGELPEGDNVVEFSNPIDINDTFNISGGALKELHSTYCVISMAAAGQITISAYEYVDTVTSRIMTNKDVSLGTALNQIEISDATLISAANADAVLLNVFNHYLKNQTLETDIKIQDENCGDVVTLHTEWSGDKKGRIEQLEYDIRTNTIGKVVQRIG